MPDFEQRLNTIEERNRRVEADKAWETSWTRRAILIICTYLVIGVYMNVAQIPQPWTNAIVPATAFVISTLTIGLLKKLWIENWHNKK